MKKRILISILAVLLANSCTTYYQRVTEETLIDNSGHYVLLRLNGPEILSDDSKKNGNEFILRNGFNPTEEGYMGGKLKHNGNLEAAQFKLNDYTILQIPPGEYTLVDLKSFLIKSANKWVLYFLNPELKFSIKEGDTITYIGDINISLNEVNEFGKEINSAKIVSDITSAEMYAKTIFGEEIELKENLITPEKTSIKIQGIKRVTSHVFR